MVEITDMKKWQVAGIVSLFVGALLNKYASEYMLIIIVIAVIYLIILGCCIYYDNSRGIYSKMKHSQRYWELKKEFESIEMRHDMQKVKAWKKKHKTKEYSIQLNLPEEEREKGFDLVDDSKFLITNRYNAVCEACKDKEISPLEAASIVPYGRVDFLLSVIEPIEKEVVKDSHIREETSMFDFFRELYGLK